MLPMVHIELLQITTVAKTAHLCKWPVVCYSSSLQAIAFQHVALTNWQQ
jgi:hypothetical protein